MALDVLKRFHDTGLTAEQLASAKATVKGGYPTANLQTADQVAAILGGLEIYGLGRDDVDQLFQRIDAVTLEQANAVARKYYRPAPISTQEKLEGRPSMSHISAAWRAIKRAKMG